MSLLIPESLLKEFTELKEKKDLINHEVSVLSAERDELKKQVVPMRESRDKLERFDKELRTKSEELEVLESKLKENETNVDKKLSVAAMKESMAKELEASIKELLSKQLVLLNENEEIESRLEKKKEEYDHAVLKIKSWNQQKIELDAVQKRLNETNEEIEKNTIILTNAIENNEKKLKEIHLTKRPITYYIAALQKELDRKKIDIKVMDVLNRIGHDV